MAIQKIEIGDCREVIKKYPDNFFDTLVTSPPYFGHRDYKTEPLIWDGKADCEHDWVKYVQKPKGGMPTETTTVGANRNGEANNRGHDTISNFCTKCGAWRGSLGLEPNFNLYVKHLCDIFDLIKPKIKQTGSVFVNIGDAYWGSGAHQDKSMSTGKYLKDGFQSICDGIKARDKSFDYPRKSLCLVPDRFAIEMVNRNWILRNENIWEKRNAMPTSAKDRFCVSHERVFFFVKSNETQYYTNSKTLQLVTKQPNGINGIENVDWEWIPCPRCQVIRKSDSNTGINNKQPYQQNNPHLLRIIGDTKIPLDISEQVGSPRARYNRTAEQQSCSRCNSLGKIKSSLWEGHDYFFEPQYEPITSSTIERVKYPHHDLETKACSNEYSYDSDFEYGDYSKGRMPRTVWDIPTKGFQGSHFACYPVELLRLPILSTCPLYVCKKCGKPRERITQSITLDRTATDGCGNGELSDGNFGSSVHEQVGWSSCSCGVEFDAGWVLDPFAGSGTTLEFCRDNNRNAVGIELNPAYKPLSVKRARLDEPNVTPMARTEVL